MSEKYCIIAFRTEKEKKQQTNNITTKTNMVGSIYWQLLKILF